jgi:hypothetical protein
MRFATILGVVALGAMLTTGCGRSASTPAAQGPSQAEKDKHAILRVLRADQELTRQRDALPPGATPSKIAWAIGRYCDDLERLDMSDCPADFRVAYRHHVGAWREARAAIAKLPDDIFEGVFMGAMNSILRGELDGGASRLEGDVKRSLERVRDTWIEVEKIGARYGAAL